MIAKRIELVGPIPRLVFNASLYERAVSNCRGKCNELAKSLTNIELYDALFGRYCPSVETHSASASGKIFHLYPIAVKCENLLDRVGASDRPRLQLTPFAQYELQGRLESSITALRKENFENFAYDWLCRTQDRLAEVQYDREEKLKNEAYKRIASLRSCDRRVYRPGAENFTFIDFATSCTTWFNAKWKKISKNNVIDFDATDTAERFLKELETHVKNMGLSEDIKKVLDRENPFIHNSDEPRTQNPKYVKSERAVFQQTSESQ